MATVRMKTLECGPEGSFAIDELREVSFKQGEMLVDTNHAVWVDKGVPPTKAELKRLEAEKLEAERIEAEKLEAEKLEAEKLEAERLASGDPEFATAPKAEQTAKR